MPVLAYRWAVAAVFVTILSCGAHTQTAQEFYKNRQLTLVVGYEVGNDYDIGARLWRNTCPGNCPVSLPS